MDLTTEVSRGHQIADVQIFGERAFYYIQKRHLFQAINSVYNEHKHFII